MASDASPSADQLRNQLDELGVEFVFAQFVDMHGKPSAKLVPGRAPRRAGLRRRRVRRASPPATSARSRAIPTSRRCRTASTLTHLPWKPNIARFACDITVEGEAWPYCPRTILRNQLARAKDLGFEFKIGCELEYFLVRRREDGGDRDRRPARHAREALLRHARADARRSSSSPTSRGMSTRSAGATTRTTTRTRTASSSRTSSTTTRSSPATARSSSATWSSRSRRSAGCSRRSCRSRSRS